jgi:hypothetical protein
MRVVQGSPRNFSNCRLFWSHVVAPFVDMAPSAYNLRITILELYRISRCGRFKVSRFHSATVLVLVEFDGPTVD